MSASTKKDGSSRPPVGHVTSVVDRLRHQSLDDVISPVFWRDVAVEFVLCAFVECCVILLLTTLRQDLYQPSITHIGLFVGFFVYALTEGYGPVNGARVNPAACWGLFLAGRISAARSKHHNLSL